MTEDTITVSDGASIFYKAYGSPSNPALVLLHGWSGSCAAFVHNVAALSQIYYVITPDLRGHGGSPGTKHGARVARLAKDLHDLLDVLQLERAAVVGCSIGSAIMWAYVELFSSARLSAAIFVDQAPLQQFSADGSWTLGSLGLYSSDALSRFSALLQKDPKTFLRDVPYGCLTHPKDADVDMFHAEALRADPGFLARLMEDHNTNDWRETLTLVKCPALVVAGAETKIFPLDGIKYVATKIAVCELKIIEDSGHWMFFEKPDDFNETLLTFLDGAIQRK